MNSFHEQFDDLVRINKKMANATPTAVVDELGLLNDLRKKVDKKEKFLKEWLKNEIEQSESTPTPDSTSDSTSTSRSSLVNEDDEIHGDVWLVKVEDVVQERISTTAVRSILSEEQLSQVMTTVEYKKLTFKAKPNLNP